MRDEDKFWLSIWGILGTTICVIALSICYYNVQELRVEENLVLNGNDPLRVRCMLSSLHDQICGVLVGEK